MFVHYRGEGGFERCSSQAGALWKLAGCLVLADCSPFPFTCTTASSRSADPIPKRSQGRAFLWYYAGISFLLCWGWLKSLTSFTFWLLTPVLYAKPFPNENSLGQQPTEVLPCKRWDLCASLDAPQTIPGQWERDSGLLDELAAYFASFSQHRLLRWAKQQVADCLIFCEAAWSCCLAWLLVLPTCFFEWPSSGLRVWFVLGIPCPC